MVMPLRKITWAKSAIFQFRKSIDYIRLDSPQNAEKVKNSILQKIAAHQSTIIRHRVDKYRRNKDGNFLYFEILKHRISFYSKEDEVIIVRVRHTKMNPKYY
jgi:plasmid stabilization system protein ParE